jgi:hypothetical protein
LGLVLFLAAPLAAQDSAPLRHTVHGVVFDSVAQAPLAGAVVQIAPRESSGPLYSAATDSTGHFRIAGLPTGKFVIGFYHDALTEFGLDAPLRTFALAADTNVTIDLGVPSGPVVRALRCGGDSATSRDGLLAGFVRNAEDNTALPGATVTAEWRAIALDPGNFRVVPQRAVATVGPDGTYRVCALPLDAPLTLRVTAPGHRALVGPIVVPVAGVARQDVRLADSSVGRGPASLRGRVVHEDGKAVTSARAGIAALARDVPVQNGAFFLTELPLGTWVVEARAIGLEPRSMWFEATERGTAATTITMSDRAQPLDAVTVVGEPSRNSRILEDVLRRQRSSFGTVFLPGSPWLQGALHAADVLRAARGFRYVSPTEIYGRPVPPNLDHTSNNKRRGLCTAINVYVNGEFFPGGLEELDHVAPVRDVLAVEAYPDVAFAPLQWRSNVGAMYPDGSPRQVCAVVVVWTSR